MQHFHENLAPAEISHCMVLCNKTPCTSIIVTPLYDSGTSYSVKSSLYVTMTLPSIASLVSLQSTVCSEIVDV